GDDVATHDAAKDVDQNAFDVRVRGDDLECLGHFLFGGAATNVEEVRGLGAEQLDNVHGGHGQTGAIHHAADFAIQRDVVQVELGCSEFLGILFGLVARREDVGLAVEGVVVKAHLGVEALEIAVFHHDQRVDLQHLHVLFKEQAIQVLDQLDALLDLRTLEAKGTGHAAAVEIRKASRRIDAEADDLFGGRGRDLFDIHAAFGRGDEADARAAAINQKREIQLALDVAAVLDIDAVDLLTGLTRLMGDEGAAQHLTGQLFGLLD